MRQNEVTAAPVGSCVQVIRFTVDQESIFRDALRGTLVATSEDGVKRQVLQHAAVNAAPMFHNVKIHDCPACGFNMQLKNLADFVTQYQFMAAKIHELADTEGRYPNIYEFEANITLICRCPDQVAYTYNLGGEGLYLFSYEYLVGKFAQRDTTITVETIVLI